MKKVSSKMVESTSGHKLTEVGEIPDEWEVVRLGELATQVKNGFATGKRDENGIVQLRMNNVTPDGRIVFDSYLKVPIPAPLDEWLLRSGDFLFNNTNSIDLVGKSAVFTEAPFPCTFSNHFTRIRFKRNRVMPEWVLGHFLAFWNKGLFRSLAIRHVGQSAVHSRELLKLELRLPPLPEQRKIISILSSVDEAIQKTDEVIAKTEELKKGQMQQLLTKGIGHKDFKKTEIGDVPEEWEVVRLGEVAIEFISGGTPSTSRPEYWNGNIPWMRSASISNRFVDSGEKYITEEGLKNSAANIVPKGNVLVATRVCIGNVAVNRIDIAISQDLTGVVLEEQKAFPEYVYWALRIVENKIRSLIQGSTIKGVLREDLKNIKLPLPLITEQQEIAEILSAVDGKLEKEWERKEKLEELKKGLMQVLLTGKVRVKVN